MKPHKYRGFGGRDASEPTVFPARGMARATPWDGPGGTVGWPGDTVGWPGDTVGWPGGHRGMAGPHRGMAQPHRGMAQDG